MFENFFTHVEFWISFKGHIVQAKYKSSNLRIEKKKNLIFKGENFTNN